MVNKCHLVKASLDGKFVKSEKCDFRAFPAEKCIKMYQFFCLASGAGLMGPSLAAVGCIFSLASLARVGKFASTSERELSGLTPFFLS